ncbi:MULTISPECIES: DUF2958 domain-containing protein [unclassified Mesorhizobium]|uniref:DUF2958 domain-containing protein n=1 Tax=unclassified Mesorhizobium TaxID=325217 RepID=UPI002416893E|nr:MULTISPECIES: DUF2958 domain-containing protein [unclassified Mesorhizobium]WFP65637.1 DUF2958 domain-containing protein [Mesorhizobium sp. WSM4904]WFP78899.1 DUF2958 domain-containing protein [Mesorhizobium sp. WSM4906]
MILITEDLRARLLANGATDTETDHVPVMKLFNPAGAATWLLTELDADGDTLFGLCDLGFGFPELGSVSLAELEAVKGPLGLGIERDVDFEARFPLSVYAEAARLSGHITETERLLRQAAASLEIPMPEFPPDRTE